jgi:glucokinase
MRRFDVAPTLTIDIGGTKCAVAITDESGVHGYESWPTNGSTENLDRVLKYHARYVAEGGEPANGVGVSFGGPVNNATATVKRSVHVPGWSEFDFAHWAERTLGLPIAVDNDAKVGAITELVHGGYDTNDLIYITISTGIGAGIVSQGKLLRGVSNDAGEIGHIRSSDSELVCSCGRQGCLERLCSGYWLERDHGKPANELFDDDEFLANYAAVLARGIANAVLIVNPSDVVLGGGVSKVGPRLASAVQASLATEMGTWGQMTPRVHVSKFGYEGMHLGAREILNGLF